MPVLQGGYGDPFLRAVIFNGKAVGQKPVCLLPPISSFFIFHHIHHYSLNADQDRPGHEIWGGGLLGRLRSVSFNAASFAKFSKASRGNSNHKGIQAINNNN
jgi:hypothetical protein